MPTITPKVATSTISVDTAKLEEAKRPITKQDIVYALDTAPPLYGQFCSDVRRLYSDPYPKSIAMGDVILQVFEPGLQFQSSANPDTVHGAAFLQLLGKVPAVKFNRRLNLQTWLPYLDDKPEEETPFGIRFIAGTDLVTDLQPGILLQVPDVQLFQPTTQKLNTILAKRQFVLRKEAFTLAVGLNYMKSMVQVMHQHKSSYMNFNADGTKVELLTHTFALAGNRENRFLALYDFGPAILAIKSYQDHPTMWPTLLTAIPQLSPYFDLIKNTDFGPDPEQWVKGVYRFIINNRTFFKDIPLGYRGNLDILL